MLANRIWQDHFGTGLAATPENLGYTGSPPSHPELLEFLAAELARSGWSAKALHRLIVTSTAYRQSSAPRPEAARIDPDNRLLARYPLRRLDAESIRDAMLAASGELDDRPGGPYVPTDRTDSGEVAVDRIDPGLDPALGLSPAAPHPGRQPARGLRCPLDRHHLHPTPAVDRPAPVAQPAEFRLRRGPGRQAGRAARTASAPCGRRTTPGSTGPSCWSSAAARAGAERDAARRFLETSRPDIRACDAPDARRRAWVDFCQMLLASDAFLYVE